MAAETETQGNRLRRFAGVFKGYMGVMPLITAALAPVLTMLRAIPVYETQKSTLATFSGILGFLMVGWVFYTRRTIALGSLRPGSRATFNSLPLLLIVGAAACYVGYFSFLDRSLTDVHIVFANSAKDGTRSYILANAGKNEPIPYSTYLQLLYFGIFLCTESAFVFMAIREYILDVCWFGVKWRTGVPR